MAEAEARLASMRAMLDEDSSDEEAIAPADPVFGARAQPAPELLGSEDGPGLGSLTRDEADTATRQHPATITVAERRGASPNKSVRYRSAVQSGRRRRAVARGEIGGKLPEWALIWTADCSR